MANPGIGSAVDPFVFEQPGYRCRLEWGRRGARDAARRGDLLVVVDTLRFSTTAITATHHGVSLYPCLWEEDIRALAARVNAVVGGHRAGEDDRYTLSPLCYLNVEPGLRLALASPNGATCARYASAVPALLIGTLINARATAQAVSGLLESSDWNATVLACGERWWTSPVDDSEDGELRFAIEDYLGAGAILSYLHHPLSPEATVCAGAFRQAEPDLERILLECGSGRELQAKGLTEDVRHAARLNLYATVPALRGECLVPL
jgi:2-phosphosulfolactate phosphatase